MICQVENVNINIKNIIQIFLNLLFFSIFIENIYTNKIFNKDIKKLGILAEKSLIHKNLKLNTCKIVNRNCWKSYFHEARYGE